MKKDIRKPLDPRKRYDQLEKSDKEIYVFDPAAVDDLGITAAYNSSLQDENDFSSNSISEPYPDKYSS